MSNVNRSRAYKILVCTFAAVLGCAGTAVSANSPDFTLDFPGGLACAFELRIDGSGGNQVYREFFDKGGTLVRSLAAGTGAALTFTNVDTGATLSTTSNGAVAHVTYNADGSSTSVLTGHNILILFPTDVPAGPSTTLYVGRVAFAIDSNGTFTLERHSGTATDICAALS
jgi:hypothetical protein